ncbi:hypothetical protein D3875_15730 [Deinococcus cavernae]|uniref:Uncharacterized protein n=1 Tax=Deinococcus cavernae TaxID=2320857 RepID=A0A418V9H0_9DEIO|nr:hypothetical protein D3875_15730 [Deinococcus cavernae]
MLCGQLSGVTATQVKPLPQEVEKPQDDLIAQVNNGQFNQQLPSVAAVNKEYMDDPIRFNDLFVCEVPVTAAPTDLKIIPINLLQTDTRQELTVQKDNGTSTTFKFWWYSNKTQSVSVSGTNCSTFGSFTNQVFALKLGWNLVTFTLNDDLKNSTFVVSAPTATRYTWTAANAAGAMLGQSNDPYFLMPWLHLDKYQNRR